MCSGCGGAENRGKLGYQEIKEGRDKRSQEIKEGLRGGGSGFA